MAQKFLTDIELTQGLKDSSGDLGSSGQVLSSTGSALNWINANSAASVVYQDGFTGNGSTTAFTLANSIGNENKTQVYIDGVYQHKDTYSLSGTTLTFSTAPPNSSDIEVISFSSVSSADDILYDTDFASAGLMTTNGSGTYSITTNNSSNWNTAYTYSQVGHLPLAGGTITGNLTVGTNIGTFNGIGIGATANRDIRIGQSSTNNVILGWKYNATASSAYGILETFGGANNLVLQSAGGNVGIATTSPEVKTHIYSNDTSTKQLMIDQDHASGDAVMSFRLSGVSEYVMGIDNSDGDKFKIANSGTVGTTTRLTLDSSGNVGIGTASPAQPLSVHGNLLVRTTNADGNKNRMQCIVGGSSDAANLYLYHGNSGDGTVSVRINAQGDSYFNGGNVGIGVTSPGAKLDVNGVIRVSNSASDKKMQFQRTGGNQISIEQDAARLYFYNESTSDALFTMLNNGRCGIGTVAPSAKLHVHAASGDGLIRVTGDNIINSGGAIKGFNNGLAFNVAPSGGGSEIEAIRIQGSGNVGIGTTSPNAKLEIGTSTAWGTAVNEAITITNTGSGGNINNEHSLGRIRWNTNSSIGASIDAIRDVPGQGNNIDIAFSTNTGGSNTTLAERMRINYDGNVGIGTDSPTQSLDTTGKIRVRDGGNTTIPSIQMGASGIDGLSLPATNTIAFITNSTERMRIDSSGNVGIGTNSSATKLDIGGMADPVLRIKSDAGGDPELRFDAAAANRSARIKFYDNGSVVGGFIDYIHNGDKMNFGAGSSSGVTMTVGDGVVGIGTTSPGAKLEINDGSTQTELRISVTGDTGYSTINFADASDINPGQIYYHHQQNLMNFRTNDNDRMVINSTGNVGIGRTSPVSILELGDDTPTLTISDTGNNYNNGDVQAVLHLSGRWHSGTANPASDDYSDARMVLRKNHSDGTGGSSLAFETSAAGAGGLTEAIRIDLHQRVGIGTDSPTSTLSVKGTTNNGINVIGVGTTANRCYVGLNASNHGQLFVTGSSGQNPSLISSAGANSYISGGNVGIGTTSPSTRLHIVGNVYSTTRVQGGNSLIGSNTISSTNFATFGSNSSGIGIALARDHNASSYPDLIINSAGNIGIGTAAPAQKLDVNGYAQVDRLFQRQNSGTATNLTTPRILNIAYPGANGTFSFNPVELFGCSFTGGQVELQVTGWRMALNNGFIYWRDNGGNTSIANGQVEFAQTAYNAGAQTGSNTISVACTSGNIITITFAGWHTNSHGFQAKIISDM